MLSIIENGRNPKKSELYKPTKEDFVDAEAFAWYTSNANHLFALYWEWDALQTNIKTHRDKLLDIKRFPKDA